MKRSIAITAIALSSAASWVPAGADTLVQSSAPFSDVTKSAGLFYRYESYGASWGEFNGDVYPDLVVSNHREKPGLYVNSGGATFTNLAAQRGMVDWWDRHIKADTHGASFADLDEDGHQDVVIGIGWSVLNAQQLLMNETNGNGQRILAMRASEWGLDSATNPKIPALGGRTGIWLDYDYDGAMDLMMANRTGNSPLLHHEFVAAVNRDQFVNKAGALGFECPNIQYALMLDAYTPPTSVAGSNDFRPELFCISDNTFPTQVYETSHLVQRTRVVNGNTQTYKGMNPVSFKAEILNADGVTRSTVTSIAPVTDAITADFNNDGLQDLLLLRGRARPSGSHFGKSADGKSHLEMYLETGERGVQFYVPDDTFALDIDWNIATATADGGWRDAPLYIGGKDGVAKNIGYPQSANTLLTSVANVTADNPYHNHLTVSPALGLAQFEGKPYRDWTKTPYYQLWFEYDGTGKRRWYFRHYSDLPDPTGKTKTTFDSGYVHIQSTAAMRPGTSWGYDTGLASVERPMTPILLLQERRKDADGASRGVFVQPAIAGSMGEKVQCISATPGDFDNDGDVDVYLTCRGPASNLTNYLYENQFVNNNGSSSGQALFKRVMAYNAAGAGAAGAEGPVGANIRERAGTGDSSVTADYDVDGFLDLFVANGYNLRPLTDGGPYSLFHNDGKTNQQAQNGHANSWIEIDLVGSGDKARQTTKDAVGARVYIVDGNERVMMREQNGGYHRWSQNHQRLHFGLGQRQVVDLDVVWPNGVVNHFEKVDVNHLYRVTQEPVALTEAK